MEHVQPFDAVFFLIFFFISIFLLLHLHDLQCDTYITYINQDPYTRYST